VSAPFVRRRSVLRTTATAAYSERAPFYNACPTLSWFWEGWVF
jgi:hypothetical protein